MANVNAPMGAVAATRRRDSEHLEWFDIPASDGTAVYRGDFVASNSTGTTGGIPQCIRHTAGAPILGRVVAFAPDISGGNLTRIYRPASTNMKVLVDTDPNQEFYLMEDAVGGAVAVTAIGQNASVIYGTAVAALGCSGMMLDSSTAATTATLEIRILGLKQAADNAQGNYAIWRCKINVSERDSIDTTASDTQTGALGT